MDIMASEGVHILINFNPYSGSAGSMKAMQSSNSKSGDSEIMLLWTFLPSSEMFPYLLGYNLVHILGNIIV